MINVAGPFCTGWMSQYCEFEFSVTIGQLTWQNCDLNVGYEDVKKAKKNTRGEKLAKKNQEDKVDDVIEHCEGKIPD